MAPLNQLEDPYAHWRRLRSRLDAIAAEMTRIHFSPPFLPEGWCPAVNVFYCETCFKIYVDLAGVDRAAIDLRVETRKLSIRGRRLCPEPPEPELRAARILAMEIDAGLFEREIRLPADIDTGRVSAEQRNGLLCIDLPLRPHA